MCNQEEKCKEMRKRALSVLVEKLREARQEEKFNISRKVIKLIEKVISVIDCQLCNQLRQRIEAYEAAEYSYEKRYIIDVLLAELEVFLEE